MVLANRPPNHQTAAESNPHTATAGTRQQRVLRWDRQTDRRQRRRRTDNLINAVEAGGDVRGGELNLSRVDTGHARRLTILHQYLHKYPVVAAFASPPYGCP